MTQATGLAAVSAGSLLSYRSAGYSRFAALGSLVAPFFFVVLFLGLGAGCGDDAPGGDGSLPDGATDSGPGDAGTDAQADAAVPDPPCVTPLVTGQAFEIDPAGPNTQIHVEAAFDGESVWIVYNLPDGAGYFDVHATRLNCDGTHRVAPFRVNTTDYNDVDPTLAVGDGHMYAAWQSDTGLFPDNMELLVRTFLVDGTPVMVEDRILDTWRNGVLETGNHWLPVLGALPSGFAVAGSRAVEDASGFQVFVQRLDADGSMAEESFDASFAPLASQTFPTLAAMADGTLYLAYGQGVAPDWDDHVLYTAIAPDARVVSPLPPLPPAGRTLGEAPHLASGPDGAVYLAFGDPLVGRIVLTDAAALIPDAPETLLGEAGLVNFYPKVAATQGGGAVVWYRNVSGLRNELWIQRFTFDGASFSLSTPDLATGEWVPPYPPAITHIRDDIYFVAWSQGTSPDFRIMGAFLEPD